jgi:hypothetical protein
LKSRHMIVNKKDTASGQLLEMQAQAALLHLTSRRMVDGVRQDRRAAARVNRKKLKT